MRAVELVKSLLQEFKQRRQESRMVIRLVVLYSNGGAPRPHPVKNVTRAGAYIITEDRWYPGTIVNMVFQYDPHYLRVARIAGDPGASIRMRARLARTGEDGVGVEFVYLNRQERRHFEKFLAGAQVRGEL